jgi:hypothetical protein
MWPVKPEFCIYANPIYDSHLVKPFKEAHLGIHAYFNENFENVLSILFWSKQKGAI